MKSKTASKITIIGAGIVGLATANHWQKKYPYCQIQIIEKEAEVAAHQTGHNSGVIHSGVYYKPGSLKAQLCRKGFHAMMEYCNEKNIPIIKTGKVIVATHEKELATLEKIFQNGVANGIEKIRKIDEKELNQIEPHVKGIQAIHCPFTSIVDFKLVAQTLAHDLLNTGAKIFYNEEVLNIKKENQHYIIATKKQKFTTDYLITCAGIYSDRLAQKSGGEKYPRIIPFRGDYLLLAPEAHHLVKGLIYPVPDPSFPFLGVHFTPRVDGSIWLGPNAVLAFSREGYQFTDINPKDLWEIITNISFLRLACKYWKTGSSEMIRDINRNLYVKTLQRYIPSLQSKHCLKGPSGIRAQAINADGSLVDDFIFDTSQEQVLHVRNAPSPGATSSLAIAEHICQQAEKHFKLTKDSN